jgi:hypothetical protein
MRNVANRAARIVCLMLLLWTALVAAPAGAQGFDFEQTERYDVRIEVEPSGDLL